MTKGDIPEQNSNSKRPSALAIPLAIVLGFGLIAAAIYFGGSRTTNDTTTTPTTDNTTTANLDAINPVTADDHIRGNPNAKLVIVEYSDFDCPYCKSFHNTMQQIIDEYGVSGNVAWVYRHYPLTSLHPSAARIAEASECVAELGGNDAFWKFTDLVFGERATNEPTDVTRLPEFAQTAEVDGAAFQDCLDSQRNRSLVEEDFNNALATGGKGTPHSIVIFGNQLLEIKGAQPYANVKQMIDGLLGSQ